MRTRRLSQFYLELKSQDIKLFQVITRIRDCTHAHNCIPIGGPGKIVHFPSHKLVQQVFFNSLKQNETRLLP